jgi:hypothetical protein
MCNSGILCFDWLFISSDFPPWLVFARRIRVWIPNLHILPERNIAGEIPGFGPVGLACWLAFDVKLVRYMM